MTIHVDSIYFSGNHQLEGLHKAAAQGDRAGIMHLMKVCAFSQHIFMTHTSLVPRLSPEDEWSALNMEQGYMQNIACLHACLLLQVLGPGDAIDRLDVNGCSPLMYAVMADSRLAVEMLLNFSARREQV